MTARPRFAPALLAVVAMASLGACAASIGTAAQQQGGASPLRVLFIGNSLTAVNDLPGMVRALVDSAKAGPIEVGVVAYPGFGLEDHWSSGVARPAIKLGHWDFVVLQQGPSATEGRPSLLEYGERFATEIRAHGARPAFYMVWPARARSFDFDGVSQSYRMAAEQADGTLLPAGDAWRAAWESDSSLALYGPDGFHPSPDGTYLAALVMYAELTGRSPVGLSNGLTTRWGEVHIEPEVAALLQAAAARTVAVNELE